MINARGQEIKRPRKDIQLRSLLAQIIKTNEDGRPSEDDAAEEKTKLCG
jgi:hypothetical protein